MILLIALTTYFMSIQRVSGYSLGSHPATVSRLEHADGIRRRGPRALLMSEGTISGADSDVAYSKRKELLDAIDLYNTNKKSSWLKESTEKNQTKSKGFLGAETKGAKTIEINDEGRKIISLIEDLAKYNPTEIPLQGFLRYKEV